MRKILPLLCLAAITPFLSACHSADAKHSVSSTTPATNVVSTLESLEKTDLSDFRSVCSLMGAYEQVRRMDLSELARAEVDPQRLQREKERRLRALRENVSLHFQKSDPVRLPCGGPAEQRSLLFLVRDTGGLGLPRTIVIEFLRVQASEYVQDLHTSSWDRQQAARSFFRYTKRVLNLTREELRHIGLSEVDAQQVEITHFEGVPTS